MTGAVVLGIILLGNRFEVAAEIQHIVVPEPGLGVVGAGIPASSTEGGGADERLLIHRQLYTADQLAGFLVDVLDKVLDVADRPDVLDAAVILLRTKT